MALLLASLIVCAGGDRGAERAEAAEPMSGDGGLLAVPDGFGLRTSDFGPSPAQQETDAWQGIDGWVILLHQHGVELLQKEDWDPATTWIVLFGEAPSDPDFPFKLAEFQAKGGRVLVASDRPSMRGVFRYFDLLLVPGPHRAARTVDGFQGFPDCPLVRVRSAHPVFEGVQQLAFNRPAGFALHDGILAWLPLTPDRRVLGCVAELGPSGLGISDHSVFINLMLAEAGNARFAANVIRWFGARRAVFYYDGRIVDATLLPPNMTPRLNLAQILSMLNPALRRIETSNFPNNLARKFLPVIAAMLTIPALAILLVSGFRLPMRLPKALRGTAAAAEFDPARPAASAERFAAREKARDWAARWKERPLSWRQRRRFRRLKEGRLSWAKTLREIAYFDSL